MLLAEEREALAGTFDPEALIEEARRRARKRRLATAVAAIACVAAGLGAAFALTRHGGARPVASRPPRPPASAPRAGSLVIRLRGFGTPEQSAIDGGPCPQGRTLVAAASLSGRLLGSEAECVLSIRKVDAPGYGLRSIHESVAATYPLPGGLVKTRESRRILFARDQTHTRASFTGRITAGTGRYAHARGTLRGGGPGVGGHAIWTIRFRFRSR